MVVVILVHGICHNDPLLPLHQAIPISLAVVWDVIIKRQNNTVISVTYHFYGSGSNERSILTPCRRSGYQFLTTKFLKHTPTHVQWAQQYRFLFPTFLLHASVVNYYLQAVYHMCKWIHFYSVLLGFHVHTQKWYKTIKSYNISTW